MDWGDPYILVEDLCGLPSRRVPRRLRDLDDGDYTSRKRLVDAFADPAVDPEAGSLIGWPKIRAAYREGLNRPTLTDRAIQTLVYERGGGVFVRFVDRFPATNVTSVWADCSTHRAVVAAGRRKAALLSRRENVPKNVPASTKNDQTSNASQRAKEKPARKFATSWRA